jgi:YbbR domain-containing protein
MRNNFISKKKKVLYIIISGLVAIGIWIYVDNVKGYSVTTPMYDVPIEYVGESTTLADRGLMLLDDSDYVISLKFEGTRRLIAQLDPAKIRVQVDLSDITTTGSQSLNYKVIYPEVKFSRGITTVSASSYTASVDIGELYSKDVEIRCEIQGKVADGYIAGSLKCNPETLELRGQEEDIDQVSYVKTTLDIENAQTTVTKYLNYQYYDKNDQLIEDVKNIHAVSDQIEVTLPVNMVKDLTLKMNFSESPGYSLSNVEYSIKPETITVSGPADILKNMDSLVLDSLDLSELTGSTKYNYSITVPEGCQNLSGVTRASLNIAFKDMSSITLTATKIECINQPNGKTVTILTNELPIQLHGKTADLKALTVEDLTITADLSEVSDASGSYTVPVDIAIDSEGDVGVTGSYQIQVTISDPVNTNSANPDTAA